MDIRAYRKYMDELIREAYESSDGSYAQIVDFLRNKHIPRFFTSNRKEKERALKDALAAFEDHRHWPVDIILSQLGVHDPLTKSQE